MASLVAAAPAPAAAPPFYLPINGVLHELVCVGKEVGHDDDLYSLVKAYVGQRTRDASRRYRPTSRVEAYPLEAARQRLREILPELDAWSSLHVLAPMPPMDMAGPSRASYLASTLSAGLEMVKEGAMELRQLDAFADLYLRARQAERVSDTSGAAA